MRISDVHKSRFVSRVKILGPNECWEWQRGRFPFGYGSFWGNGRDWQAHLIMWNIVYGPVPTGKCVMHQCDNPPCCNPRHLVCGTILDNVYDMVSKGRGAKGEIQGHSKLTSDQVIAIRNERANLGTSMIDIAHKYSVTKHCIHLIVHRKNWKHI